MGWGGGAPLRDTQASQPLSGFIYELPLDVMCTETFSETDAPTRGRPWEAGAIGTLPVTDGWKSWEEERLQPGGRGGQNGLGPTKLQSQVKGEQEREGSSKQSGVPGTGLVTFCSLSMCCTPRGLLSLPVGQVLPDHVTSPPSVSFHLLCPE